MEQKLVDNILSQAVSVIEYSNHEVNDEPLREVAANALKSQELPINADSKPSKTSKPTLSIKSIKSVCSESATACRVTSSNRNPPVSPSVDTLPARKTKVGELPEYLKQRKQEISKNPSQTSRPSISSASALQKKMKLGVLPSYLKKDQASILLGEYKQKLSKYENLKTNLKNTQQKFISSFMDCKKMSDASEGKIVFNDNFKMVDIDGTNGNISAQVSNEPVFEQRQEDAIRNSYFKFAQKVLEEFRSQTHEGGDQGTNISSDQFEEVVLKTIDQFILTEVSEYQPSSAIKVNNVIDPELLQEKELYFANQIAEKDQIHLAFKVDTSSKIKSLNDQLKELNKNFIEQSKNTQNLKKIVEQKEAAISDLETVIKDNLHHKKCLESKLSKLMTESGNRLNSELDKTNNLLHENKNIQKMNQKLSDDSKSNVAKLEAEIVQLKNAAKQFENLLNQRNLSKTKLSEQKHELQSIYKEKEIEVEKLLHDISKLSKEKIKYDSEMQLLKDNLKSYQEDQLRLKSENETLASELNQAKIHQTKSVDAKDQISEIIQLKQDIKALQAAQRGVIREKKILESKFTNEKRENYTNLNMMQLRGELIKTLQEKDENNKTRIILLLKDQEEKREDIRTLSILNCAKEEEYMNMLETLKKTELENEALLHELEAYKNDLQRHNEKMQRRSHKNHHDVY